LYGREFVLVAARHTWGLDRVYFYDDKGQLQSLPTAWTDAFPRDPVVIVSAGRSAFRLEDLWELSQMIEALWARGESK
jgi:hypothetical protein